MILLKRLRSPYHSIRLNSIFAVLAAEKERKAVIEEEATIKPVVNLTDILGHWAEKDILTLVNKGAITGYADGTFKPNNHITRAEFVSILVHALELDMKGNKRFVDTAQPLFMGSLAATMMARSSQRPMPQEQKLCQSLLER